MKADNYFIERTVTDFGVTDERGRKVGIITWALVMTTRWDPNMIRPGSSLRGGIVSAEPYVLVGSHAARNGEQYGALTKDKEIGPVADPGTRQKVEAEIKRRVDGARKRYTNKYGKEQQP